MIIILGLFLLVIVILVLLTTKPFRLEGDFIPQPASSYQEAVDRVRAIQDQESKLKNLSAECGTKLMTNGKETEKVIVFLHGFTSCPDQFRKLGEQFYALGYNVYIPRQPRHGLSDRTGNPLKGLTAEELAQFGTETVDIAQGLGERVIVVGLSGGGSITTWLIQRRSDVDLAVPISPFLGVGFIPAPLTRLVTHLVLIFPDIYQWWDPVNKIDNPNSTSYSYRGYWMHALFENLRLGFTAERHARDLEPAAGEILVITNANDSSVNNDMVAKFERNWRTNGKECLQSYQFPRVLELPHDIITYDRPDGKPELVYGKLLELIQ
jgi:carboxylesterase